MKTNKTILPFGIYRLISYQIIKLSRVFSSVAISLKEQKKDEIINVLCDDLARYNASNSIDSNLATDSKSPKDSKLNIESIPIITESLAYFSPLFGILNAFEQLHSRELFFIPIDYPFVRFDTMDKLAHYSPHCDIVYAKDSSKSHPLIGIWRCDIKDKIVHSLSKNEFRILDFVALCDARFVYFDTPEFINLNTMRDYQDALRILENA